MNMFDDRWNYSIYSNRPDFDPFLPSLERDSYGYPVPPPKPVQTIPFRPPTPQPAAAVPMQPAAQQAVAPQAPMQVPMQAAVQQPPDNSGGILGALQRLFQPGSGYAPSNSAAVDARPNTMANLQAALKGGPTPSELAAAQPIGGQSPMGGAAMGMMGLGMLSAAQPKQMAAPQINAPVPQVHRPQGNVALPNLAFRDPRLYGALSGVM